MLSFGSITKSLEHRAVRFSELENIYTHLKEKTFNIFMLSFKHQMNKLQAGAYESCHTTPKLGTPHKFCVCALTNYLLNFCMPGYLFEEIVVDVAANRIALEVEVDVHVLAEAA